MSKPRVRYARAIVEPVVGRSAILVLAEQHHTISKEAQEYHDNVITTSTVQSVGSDGEFETRNTLYRPLPDEQA